MGKKNNLRRGFRKEAEEYAEEFRAELGLRPNEPLHCKDLANHLAIPVQDLSNHPTISGDLKSYFACSGRDCFSAATLCNGLRREILLNDSHHPNRQNSSIMHEISHILLGHPAKPPLLKNNRGKKDSCRNFDPVLEREANELGFTLLIPKVAALNAVENYSSIDEAANFYGVSKVLLDYRIKISDARRWALNRSRNSYR